MICWSNPRNAFLAPCGHVVTCVSCAEKLRICPIDRTPITQVMRAYL